MRLTHQGRLGVGTNGPTYKLEVADNIEANTGVCTYNNAQTNLYK